MDALFEGQSPVEPQRADGPASPPLLTLTAAEAFARRKDNPFGSWPMADDPDNRFAPMAAPHYTAGFTLQPGQKIITIGSCFARNIEEELVARGFDIPMQRFTVDKREWARDPTDILNNYVPGAIAPQIRWAFGMETYDSAAHAIEVAPGRFVDPYLAPAARPITKEELLARRASLDALYRELATSQAVIITLGFVEAWFDRTTGNYVNAPPPLAILKTAPQRFELHVLDYNGVRASLVELFDLLDRVCPPAYRIILTVSPAPLHLTYTQDDIAVANTYSKSVLRAAAGEICARRANADYFPSYESVILSPRDVAYGPDQIHVSRQIVRFNIDRMLQQYLPSADSAQDAATALAAARDLRARGHRGSALQALQAAWSKNPEDPRLTVALAQWYHGWGMTGRAARLLSAPGIVDSNDPHAMLLLARIHNSQGRHAEAAELAERIAATRKLVAPAALVRAEACYRLERFEEGLAALTHVTIDGENHVNATLWKARLLEKLGRFDEADESFQQCVTEIETFENLLAYAQFLAGRGRLDEARERLSRAILLKPHDPQALTLRAQLALGAAGGQARFAGLRRLFRRRG